jgi:hypothetical protein
MTRTISPAAAILSITCACLATFAGITAARNASADAMARECVAQGINPAQCWENARPTF